MSETAGFKRFWTYRCLFWPWRASTDLLLHLRPFPKMALTYRGSSNSPCPATEGRYPHNDGQVRLPNDNRWRTNGASVFYIRPLWLNHIARSREVSRKTLLSPRCPCAYACVQGGPRYAEPDVREQEGVDVRWFAAHEAY